eukprot:scaffold29388_cov54-Attheya_sp.AAC.4
MMVSPRRGLIFCLHFLLGDVLRVGRACLFVGFPPQRALPPCRPCASLVVPCEKYSPLLVEIPSVIPPLPLL